MSLPISRLEQQQCRALSFALDQVFLRTPAPTREDLERTVAALCEENATLRAQIRALEPELYPDEADLEPFEAELESRLAGESTREVESAATPEI
jgi:hypothetical protein